MDHEGAAAQGAAPAALSRAGDAANRRMLDADVPLRDVRERLSDKDATTRHGALPLLVALASATRREVLTQLTAQERSRVAASLPHALDARERSVANDLFDATPDAEFTTVRRVLIAITGTFTGKEDDPTVGGKHEAASALTTAQKHRGEQLTSLFENPTTELHYAYIEDIKDGRGFTAGRAGFCTGTGDFYEVVVAYTLKVPHNPLAPFLPELKLLAEKSSARTSRLPHIVRAWKEAAKDPAFRAVQDGVVDKLYYSVAMAFADEHGCRLPLTLAALYDAIIQHGAGSDADGLPALLDRTSRVVGGDPRHGVDEKRWLKVFLRVRRQDLACADDPGTRAAWSESTGRADVFLSLADEGNYDLAGPLTLHAGHYTNKIE